MYRARCQWSAHSKSTDPYPLPLQTSSLQTPPRRPRTCPHAHAPLHTRLRDPRSEAATSDASAVDSDASPSVCGSQMLGSQMLDWLRAERHRWQRLTKERVADKRAREADSALAWVLAMMIFESSERSRSGAQSVPRGRKAFNLIRSKEARSGDCHESTVRECDGDTQVAALLVKGEGARRAVGFERIALVQDHQPGLDWSKQEAADGCLWPCSGRVEGIAHDAAELAASLHRSSWSVRT